MPALEIPSSLGFNTKVFRISSAQQVNPSGIQGFIQTLNRSSPFWVAEYTTPPLREAAYNEAISFFDQLEGSMNTFLAYDPRKVMPFAYRTFSIATTVWGASPRITAQDYANSTINLDQMSVGAVITKGDLISVKVGEIWYLFRSQANVTVGGGGTVTGLLVKPRPNILSFTTTVIRYQKPVAEMKVIGDIDEQDSVDVPGTIFKFKAAQFMNRQSA